MLNITDRAVSKWETGKSLPDSSIMLELCEILGITVNELLCGERIEMEKYEEKVNENLIELKRRDENNINTRTIISIVFSVIMFTGIFIIPFILVISLLTKTSAVLRIGAPISILSIVFIWITYFLVTRFKNRMFLTIGSAILLIIPFAVMINITLAKMLGIAIFDIWDAFSGVIIVIIAASFIIADYKMEKLED